MRSHHHSKRPEISCFNRSVGFFTLFAHVLPNEHEYACKQVRCTALWRVTGCILMCGSFPNALPNAAQSMPIERIAFKNKPWDSPSELRKPTRTLPVGHVSPTRLSLHCPGTYCLCETTSAFEFSLCWGDISNRPFSPQHQDDGAAIRMARIKQAINETIKTLQVRLIFPLPRCLVGGVSPARPLSKGGTTLARQ